MKRNFSKIEEDESRLSRLLFNSPNNFSQKLNTNNNDIGIDSELMPAWIDEDDEITTPNSKKNNEQCSTKLKYKYNTLMGTPQWAKFTGKVKKESDDEDEQIVRTVGHLQTLKSHNLKKDILEIKRLSKINSGPRNQGVLNTIEFHPKASVALVGGSTGVVSLYSVSGDTNNKLHNFALQGYRISNCHFSPSGNEAFISSAFGRNYCIYNLINAAPKSILLPSIAKKAKVFVLSPDGKYLAISDGLDELYIVCAFSQELLRVLKHNSQIQSATFNSGSDKLYCYSVTGEIFVWNLSMYRIQSKFQDSGCVTASCITVSPCGRFLAAGSGEGIVNVYETSNLTTSSPLPSHVIQNLRTNITSMKFNSSTEILALASSVYANAMKLVHIPSFHVFQNFPTQNTGLDIINCLSFSPNGGYMALGSGKLALLYRLKHYENY